MTLTTHWAYFRTSDTPTIVADAVWYCAICGAEKPATRRQMKHKYCSHACKGIARRGALNPAYRHGRRANKQGVSRAYARMTSAKVKAITDWAKARAELGTAEDLAQRLGISRRAVYMYSPCYGRKGNASAQGELET